MICFTIHIICVGGGKRKGPTNLGRVGASKTRIASVTSTQSPGVSMMVTPTPPSGIAATMPHSISQSNIATPTSTISTNSSSMMPHHHQQQQHHHHHGVPPGMVPYQQGMHMQQQQQSSMYGSGVNTPGVTGVLPPPQPAKVIKRA
jgi:hypothetical protein